MSIIEPETSIWYAICWIVVIVRFLSKRIRLGSWKNLQIDDYLMIPAMITLTILMALMHIIVHTNSNLIAPGDDMSKWTPDEFKKREYGSKLTIVIEQMHISTIWMLKACILIMYSRMTDLLRLHVVVKAAAIYVGVAYLVMQILWFGVWCRPFAQYWAVPPNSTQCSAMLNHLITNAVLNISSDCLIMIIPMPLLLKVKIPLKHKAILGGIFFIGVFTIFAAAKNKYESFKNPFSTNWMIWYLREAFTATLCANLPLTRPVLQRLFKLGDWTQPATATQHYDSNGNSHSRQSTHRLRNMSKNGNSTTIKGGPSKPLPVTPRSGSEEFIITRNGPLEIMYETEVRIDRQPARRPESDEVSIMEMGKRDQPEYPEGNSPISDPELSTAR